jgi:hypothetical protein
MNRQTRYYAHATLLCSLFATGATLAQAPVEAQARLTDKHRWMLTGSIGASYSPDEPQNAGHPQWSIDLRPGFYYFLLDHIALGAYLNVGARHDRFPVDGRTSMDSTSLTLGGGLQATLEIELNDRAGLMLSPWVGDLSWRQEFEAGEAPPNSFHFVEFGCSLPLLLHLNENVGIGFGPYVKFDYAIDNGRYGNRLDMGLTSTVFWSF